MSNLVEEMKPKFTLNALIFLTFSCSDSKHFRSVHIFVEYVLVHIFIFYRTCLELVAITFPGVSFTTS